MNLRYLLFIALTVFLSCEKEETPENTCLVSPLDFLKVEDCDTSSHITCVPRRVQDLRLSEISKQWLPRYCQETGSVLSFKNKDEKSINLRLIGKNYWFSGRYFDSKKPCPQDSSSNLFYCGNIEIASLSYTSLNDSLELIIELYSRPNIETNGDEEFLDELKILRKNSSITVFSKDFTYVIDSRNSSDWFKDREEFYSSIELNSKVFDRVISNNRDGIGSRDVYKYYYTKEHGLIAFVDDQNELWVID